MYNLDPKEKQHGRVYMFGGVCVCVDVTIGVCAMHLRVVFSTGWSHVLEAGSVNIVVVISSTLSAGICMGIGKYIV